MFRVHAILAIGLSVILLSCSVSSNRKSSGADCYDLSGVGVSYGLFTQTCDLWAQSFVNRYLPSGGGPDKFFLSLPAAALQSCLQGPGGSGYDGVKIYLGLDTSITSISDMYQHVRLILVPFDTLNNVIHDTTFSGSCGPVKVVGLGNQFNTINDSTALVYIENWKDHYQYEDSIMVRVNGFVVDSSALQAAVNRALLPAYDKKVYVIFGYHTISPDDGAYCLSHAPASQHYANNGTYGYNVIALILSTRQGGIFMHSEDFLRPCPRFCGDSRFPLPFHTN